MSSWRPTRSSGDARIVRTHGEETHWQIIWLLQQPDPSGEKLLVLIPDRAGWHVAKELKVPPNVVLFHLPPSTPELQPVEPLWPLVREGVANKTFASLAVLREPLVRRCEWLAAHPEVVKGAVGFRWAAALGWQLIHEIR